MITNRPRSGGRPSEVSEKKFYLRNWVQFYFSNESRKQVNEIKQILNKLSQNENEKSNDIMKKHFANACKYEPVA
jgi:thiaminase